MFRANLHNLFRNGLLLNVQKILTLGLFELGRKSCALFVLLTINVVKKKLLKASSKHFIVTRLNDLESTNLLGGHLKSGHVWSLENRP